MLTSCQLVVFQAAEVASTPTDMDYVELCGPERFRDTLSPAISVAQAKLEFRARLLHERKNDKKKRSEKGVPKRDGTNFISRDCCASRGLFKQIPLLRSGVTDVGLRL